MGWRLMSPPARFSTRSASRAERKVLETRPLIAFFPWRFDRSGAVSGNRGGVVGFGEWGCRGSRADREAVPDTADDPMQWAGRRRVGPGRVWGGGDRCLALTQNDKNTC